LLGFPEDGFLTRQSDLQLRYSAGLSPASTITPWHPGIGLPQLFSYALILTRLKMNVNKSPIGVD